MALLQALIVDDEAHGRANLRHLLQTYCPQVQVAGEAASAAEALTLVERLQPEVVFLDIRMPRMNGFAFLQEAHPRQFSVIFVTAHDTYGIQAVKASAVDYLLKPISIDELREAVAKVYRLHEQIAQNPSQQQVYRQSMADLAHNLAHQQAPERLTLPHGQDLEIVALHDIIRLQAEDNYTFVFLHNRRNPLLVPRTLKYMEEVLPEARFVRVHRSHIIHLAYLKTFVKDEGGMALMRDGARVPVSRRRQAAFLRTIRQDS